MNIFNFSDSFYFLVSLPTTICNLPGRGMICQGWQWWRKMANGNPWPHACPWTCTGSHILIGAQLLEFAGPGITFDLDSFNSVGLLSVTESASHCLLPPLQPCSTYWTSPVPPLACHTGPLPLSFTSGPQMNLRGVPSPNPLHTSLLPDNTVLFVPRYSPLSQTFPDAWALTWKEKIRRPLFPNIYVLNMERF